ncbi:hypothetical protein P3T76_008062 [Phytophthora citrophthora]|uniref:Uncharacterized protein n=1 Tax=Phytophthora citrophthora TaxID=4793 RepID=A0AAD9LLL8_9STRA|nr:hypothetical protein P3T76_008062 [Phytophthora citrophthora]
MTLAMATAGAVVEEVEKGHHLHKGFTRSGLSERQIFWFWLVLAQRLRSLRPSNIQHEITSIIHQMASIADGQAVELPGPFPAPMVPANFRCGEVHFHRRFPTPAQTTQSSTPYRLDIIYATCITSGTAHGSRFLFSESRRTKASLSASPNLYRPYT